MSFAGEIVLTKVFLRGKTMYERKILGIVLFVTLGFYQAESLSATPDCSVRDSQATLKAMGYKPGPIDGVWGKTTAGAILEYQEEKGIAVTGHLDKATCSSLSEDRAEGGIKIPPSTSKIIGWKKLERCRYIRERRLKNRLSVSAYTTSSLVGKEMYLAEGEVHGGPYDAMGVGTYVKIEGKGVVICGVHFRNGGFSVTREGFKLDPGTQWVIPR